MYHYHFTLKYTEGEQRMFLYTIIINNFAEVPFECILIEVHKENLIIITLRGP